MRQQVYFGVVGNMGPEADIAFQNYVRKASITHLGATTDQQHMAMVVLKNPQIPDRSLAINEGGASPVPALVATLRMLEKLGVYYAVMPCNTAHYFKDAVQRQTKVHLLDMLQATAQAIVARNPAAVVGILATTGTCNAKLYDKYFDAYGIKYIKPTPCEQEAYVHSAIYGTQKTHANGTMYREPSGLKSGVYEANAEALCVMIAKFVAQGCDTILLGCTELPLVETQLKQAFAAVTFVNPMVCVAEQAVQIFAHATLMVQHNTVKWRAAFRCHGGLITPAQIAGYVAARTVMARYGVGRLVMGVV